VGYDDRRLVLVYGSDPQLLATRRWMLEQAGARVLAATKLSDFSELAPDEAIDLIVFCHSLSKDQCDCAFADAHTRWPEVQILVLVSGSCGCQPRVSDLVADASLGPAYFVQTVAKLLGA
jgi:hypothetical protein